MSIRSLTFQVVAMMAIPAFAAYHKSTAYNFTFSSFAREGVITLRTEGEAGGKGYHLGEETETQEGSTTIQTPVFDRAIDVTPLVGEGDNQLTGTETVRPIAYIPQNLSLTSISIVTPGNVAPEFLILTLEGGTTRTLRLAGGTTPITLHGTWQGAVGTRSGVVHTYTVAEGEAVTLNLGTEHPTFSVSFQSSDDPGQAQNRTVYCVDGRPFLRIVGHAMLEHHIFKINAAANPDHTNAQSLATLLAGDASAHTFVDDPNTVIVVEFEGEGGGVSLDKEVLKSPIVFGSSVTPDKAHVHFPGTVKLESALTFRDGAAQGGVSIYGPTDTANYEAARWNPSAMLLRCDLTLCTPLPAIEGNWFLTHSTTIPAGRTFRLELDQPVGSEDNLPNLSFADATSRLELASDAASPEDYPLGIPSKYQTLLCTQSGTLVLDRNVSVENANEEGSSVLSGFVLSDSRVAYGIPVNRPLETHVILRAGHTYDFGDRLGFMNMLETPIGKATLTVEGGTVEVSTLSLTATDATLDIQGGTVTAESLDGIDDGTNTAITVAEGATLRLDGGLLAGAADTTATLDLTVKGTLNLGADLNMLPALRRELRLEGGAIAAAGATPVSVNCKDGTAAEVEDFLIVSGGGTLKGSLTVDGISGTSSETSPLIIDTGATVKDLRDFAGTVTGVGRLEAIEGTLGDVTLGDTWLAATTGKKLGDVLTGWTENGTRYHGAADFAGTIGFTAGAEGAPKTLDFTDLDELTSLGMAFRINNHQHIIMRLDQYADATIRWPDNPQGITLTLIESGAYGGELTLPHFPHVEGDEGSGVKFEFATFDPAAENGYTVRQDGYSHTHTEDGVNDTLVWDNPVFTGKGAWIDIEFNGDTRNTGWFTLGDYNGNPVTTDDQRNRYNGLLAGDEPYVVLEQTPTTTPSITASHQADFVDSKHPAQAHGSLPLHYRPYVALSSLEYPEAWTVSLRLSAPSAAHTCILALGHNYTGTTAGIPKYEGDVYSLIFATGDTSNEICLWVVPGLEGEGVSGTVARPEAPAFTVTLADATTAQHTFSVICDGTTMNLYVDGAWLGEHTLPGGHLSNGLQVGVQLGGTSIPSALQKGFADAVGVEDGGSIDFLRFYKGAMPEAAMVEVADRTPYVRENLRYVRYVPISTAPDGFTKIVPTGGETWIQDGAWQAETWNGSAWVAGDYFDQPAEGAECRLLVAPDEYTIQVNVERQVTGETDGAGNEVPADHYFYSPNRNYAALVVRAQDEAARAATLRLVPLGVTEQESDDTDSSRPWETQLTSSAWFTTTEESTPGNRTGFRYGKLRFTGGAEDPITSDPAIPNLYGSAYLLSGGATSASGEGTVIEEGEITQDGAVQYGGGTYYYRYWQEVKVRYATTGAIPMVGIYDAGVCYLSRHANTVLAASADQIQTIDREWRQPLVYENGTYTANGERYIHRTTLRSTSDDTTVGAQLNTLEMVAGLSLTRGVMDEVVQGTTEAGRDYVLGHAGLPKDQASEDVWVPFFGSDSTWKFYDDTRVEGGDGNGNGAKSGLFARGVQTPGRLYLDFTVGVGTGDAPGTADGDPKPNTGNFSEQAWYRYGYEANQTTATLSGMKPVRASADDFAQAVAFQIRLSKKTGNVTLTLDDVPKARVQTFYVEEEAGATKALTLKLTRAKEVEALKIWKSVVAAARLDVSNNNTGVATATSGEGNALNLRPAKGIRTPVHRGNATHGHGAYIVGTTQVDWDFGAASSVPRLEVIPRAELTFTVGQDFRRQDIGGITLVAQGKETSTFPKPDGSDDGPNDDDLDSAAWIHHRSAEPFLGQDVELGEGAIFGFHADAASSNADVQNEGVVLAGELRLTGNATLRADFESASGGAGAVRLPHFVAAGGIHATESGLTLIVDAPTHQSADGQGGTVDWHCHTATLTGDDFRLWKTGPGTMTFYANTPPSVTGKVTVEEGTLAVTAAAETAAVPPVGAKGLHVKKDATLADSGRMSGANLRLALIPDGATLSGGGTVAGRLGLKGGATYLAKQGEALTATGGIFTDDSLEADIAVSLPGDYEAGTPYLVANREERDVRRRLLPKKGGEWWDAIAWIDTGAAGTATSYAARPPQFPAPTDYDGYKPGTSPTTITGTIEKPLINQYQNAGHAYVGQTFGRTRAGNKKLNPTELSDALLCFTNISAFVEDVGVSGTREYVDGTNFYVGYEFGVSQMAFAQDYVVLEVSVESALEDSFPDVDFSEAQQAFVADFSGATKLSFDLIDANGEAHPLGEGGLDIPVEEVTDMDGTPAATPGVRWFRIPYARLLEAAGDGNIRLRATATSPYARRP